MSMTKRFRLIVILLLITNLTINARSMDKEDPSYYLSEIPLNRKQFGDDFHEIHQIVLDNYSFYRKKHLNMDSLYQVFPQRIENSVETPADYGLLLLEYFANLKMGHASIYFPSYMAYPFPVFINDSLFVDKPSNYLKKCGLKDKDQIISINHVPVKKWMDDNEKYMPASTKEARRLKAARSIFKSYTDTVKFVTVKREGKRVDVTLPLKPLEYFQNVKAKNVEWKVFQDSIGYIAINTMMGNTREDFKKAFDEIRKLPYLIIDVRNNGGGDSRIGRDICKFLVRQEQEHCLGGSIIVPDAESYKGKIFFLTSTFTFSAAESFTIDMKESGNAILIGEPTGGDTGNGPKVFCTKHGISFCVPTRMPKKSPKGFPLEGIGVPPHYRVSQTVEDFMKGEDTQLNFVLHLIQQH